MQRRQTPTWRVSLPDGRTAVVAAWTRFEARARAKEQFGIRDRLPQGATLEHMADGWWAAAEAEKAIARDVISD